MTDLNAALDRFERAAMAYERLGSAKRDDEKTRQMRKDGIAELAAARETLRARLSQAGAGGGVVVKPLEWSKDNSVGGHGGWIGRAGSETRTIRIGWMVEEPFEFGSQSFKTLDEAKAAAQADYEARILAALAPNPSAGEPITANCCHCGRIIDTREKADGGDDFGCQLTDGRWTCSPECWDVVTEATPPATPVQPTASVEAVDLHDFVTHRTAWRNALIICEGAAQAKGDEANRSYWSHEIGAFDRAFAIIELLARASLTPAPTQGGGDRHWDDLAVDRFAYAMKAKLAKKRVEGRGGWDRKIAVPGLDGRGFYYECPNSFLSEQLREHVDKGDPVDVANFAMMIHQRSERIAAPSAPVSAPSPAGGVREALEAVDRLEALAFSKQMSQRPLDYEQVQTIFKAVSAVRASLSSPATPVSEPSPSAGETIRASVEIGYASPSASAALATPPAPSGEARKVLERAADEGYRVCAETRHVSLGDKVRAAILTLSNPAPAEKPAKQEDGDV